VVTTAKGCGMPSCSMLLVSTGLLFCSPLVLGLPRSDHGASVSMSEGGEQGPSATGLIPSGEDVTSLRRKRVNVIAGCECSYQNWHGWSPCSGSASDSCGGTQTRKQPRKWCIKQKADCAEFNYETRSCPACSPPPSPPPLPPPPPPAAPPPPPLPTKLNAPDGESYDYFGISVATSATHVVVGAEANDDNGSSSGSAYIFESDGGLVAKLTAPDGKSKDSFGSSVAISATRVVVGAPEDEEDDGNDSCIAYYYAGPGDEVCLSSTGSAYIFESDGGFVAKLTAPDGETNDWFGGSVAISATHVVVGAHGDDDKGVNSGSAYIFESDGGLVAKLTAPDGERSDIFGQSVAISATHVVVGASSDDDSSGSAYIFESDGGFVAKLTAPDGESYDYFGQSVAISATHVVVGARYDDDNGSSSGSAYIFESDGGFVAKLTAPDGKIKDFFGSSVAISATHVVVGAHGDDDNGPTSGSAYIPYISDFA